MARRKIIRKIRKTKNLNDGNEDKTKSMRSKQNSGKGVALKIEKLTVSSGQFKPVILDLTPVDDLTVIVPGESELELKALTPFLNSLHRAVSKAVPVTDLLVDDEDDDDDEDDENIEDEEEKPKKKPAKKPISKKEEDEEDEEDESEEVEDDEPALKKKALLKKGKSTPKKKSSDDDYIDSLLEDLEDEE